MADCVSFCCSEPTNGAEVAVNLLEQIVREKGPEPHGLEPYASTALQRSVSKSGSIRLKDALMVAHLVQHTADNEEVGLARLLYRKAHSIALDNFQ